MSQPTRVVSFGYPGGRREERTLASLEVRCHAGRIQSVHGRLPDGGTFIHPEPETLAYVLDRATDVAYPRYEPAPRPGPRAEQRTQEIMQMRA